ncbi:MAG: hypothetical protein QG568_438 [Patescibacteria group bacterium]|nr:hypothetical protein [Patescibacteria group bacterium]
MKFYENPNELNSDLNEDLDSPTRHDPSIKRSEHLRGVMRSLAHNYRDEDGKIEIPEEIIQRVSEDYGLSPEELKKIASANTLERPQQEAVWRTFFFIKREMRKDVVDLHSVAACAHVPLSFVMNVYEAFGGDEEKLQTSEHTTEKTIGESGNQESVEDGITWSWKSDEHRDKMLELNKKKEQLQSPENIDNLVNMISHIIDDYLSSDDVEQLKFPFKIESQTTEQFIDTSYYAYCVTDEYKVSFDNVVDYVIQKTQVDEFIDIDFVKMVAYRICNTIELRLAEINGTERDLFNNRLKMSPSRANFNPKQGFLNRVELKKYIIEYPEEDEHLEDLIGRLNTNESAV